MNAKKILFPTDFSHTGDAALEYATSLAENWGAKLFIVHVEEHPLAYGGGEMYYGVLEPDTEALRKMLEAVVPKGKVAYEHHLLMGEPAQAVVDFAREKDVDLIVLGTHGRSGLTRLVMGSVAEAIVRSAHCPVLTVKASKEAPVAAK
jgi:nucleotide-binding universal stress UspA family protein